MCESFLYSVPEEKKSGSVVVNVLQDLRVEGRELSARRARLASKSAKQYFRLDPHSGNILLQERIDREALCGQKDPCVLLSEVVLEDPLQLHRIEIQIEDANDHPPRFSKEKIFLEIPEQTPIYTQFPLEGAQDADIRENAVQNYTLSPNEHFRLEVQTSRDGSKYAELVLEKPLDREVNAQVTLVLTAVDGGIPQRSGTAQILINVLDANDNFPQFAQSLYEVKLRENSPLGTLVAKVEASDKDFGSYAEITYSFSQVPEIVLRTFKLNRQTGEISLIGPVDYEEKSNYELSIQATDGGGLSAYCKVLVEVEDENDNAPEVAVTSITSPLPEDSPVQTVVALFSVTDPDSGDNGRTTCTIDPSLPFALRATENSYYQLVTQWPLDRERITEYNMTVKATDRGSPQLTSLTVISIPISDINDNPPVFERPLYEMQVRENNIPGLLIGSVHASDLDAEQNAKLTYALLPGKVGDSPVSSYVSINSETGNLYALRSFDYENMRELRVMVRALDKGSPPLSSQATVRVHVVDENDHAPFILHPLQNSSSPSSDLVPRGAEAGYLVTKVVATDHDSGQNSWLSYQLLKATEPGLFVVGAQNGEVRTTRPVQARDSSKQTLVVAVRDSGHPPQSASATLRILLVDGFSDPYMKMVDVPRHEEAEEEGRTLTMYLIVCLAAISSVFLLSITIFVAVKIQKHRKLSRALPAVSAFPFPENGSDSQSGFLPRTYHYDVCLTGGSLSSEFRFLRPLIPVFSMGEPNLPGKHVVTPGAQAISEQTGNKESWEQVSKWHLIKSCLVQSTLSQAFTVCCVFVVC
ncbi:protocadherin beta-16-like isoform X2 [Varanus komodoensis]|uniref:protocadherin beta-16-like isoform X2 n=1 Tax=Varanus komodoensis TaxID=61221 RepID=UPI001CF7A5BF|nr:protocadherin beta-16-like isoform X2 [Varanus komodoensis]